MEGLAQKGLGKAGLHVCTCVQAGRVLDQSITDNISRCNPMTLGTKRLLTSELHVGHNDLLTNASECILVLKQMLVVRPFTD